MRKFVTFTTCAFVAAMTMVGCSAANGNEPELLSPLQIQSLSTVNNAPEAIHKCNRAPGTGVLITFDDFGTDEQVQAILGKLRQHRMRAAFFPTGSWAEQHLGLIDQMKSEGHIVGNHTYSHADLGNLSAHNEAGFYSEIYPLKGVANTNPMLLRPPFESGAYDQVVGERLSEQNIQACTWTVDTRDWQGGTVEQIMNLLKFGDPNSAPLGPDGVVLAHMHAAHSPDVINAIVQYLGEMNWEYERTT